MEYMILFLKCKQMFCSIIIPTVGRDSLKLAVSSALNQTMNAEHYEIIVVNDSGKPLLGDLWAQNGLVQLLHTQMHNRCVARNVGAAVAKGDYLCFLDDDDRLLPEALEKFLLLASQNPGADWLYGGVKFLDSSDNLLGLMNFGKSGNCFAEIVSEIWIPIQASLIRTESFFLAGGFDPNYQVVEDLDLLRRITVVGDIANTKDVVAIIRRGSERNKTDTPDALPYIRLSRGKIMSGPGVFRRLYQSAGDSAFLHGLILRIFLTVLAENIRNKRWLQSFSKSVWIAVAIFRSLRFLTSRYYWHAVRFNKPLHHELVLVPHDNETAITDWIN